MGTIQDKLEYLHTSLDLVRQKLESYGYEISEMTTRKICEMLSEGIENTLLFNFRKSIDRWIVFENGRIYDKLTGEDYNFTYNYENEKYIFTRTTQNLVTDHNLATNFNILLFNKSGYFTNIATGLGIINPAKNANNASYFPCYDSDTRGYFLYLHFDYDGDLSKSYFTDGEFKSSESALFYSSGNAANIRFTANSTNMEGSNIVFLKEELTPLELQMLRKAFVMDSRDNTEKPLGEITEIPVENGNEVSVGAFFKKYYHPSKMLSGGIIPYIIKKDDVPLIMRETTKEQSTLLEKQDISYESVHIVNLTDEYQVGDCLPIESYPIPFSIGDLYQPQYTSDNEEVVKICGDVMHCVGAGNANITLLAGNKSDSVNVKVNAKPEKELNTYYVDQELFGVWEENQDIIFQQIQYAHDNGYNHILFPDIVINVIAHYFDEGESENSRGEKSGYKVPSNIKIEFPGTLWFHKGKACESYLDVNDNKVTAGGGYHFFCFSSVENTEIKVNTLIGERYDFRNPDGTYGDSSKDYSEQCCFIAEPGYVDGIEDGKYMHGRNIRCKVDIENSTDVIGFHIGIGGGFNFWNIRNVIPKDTSYNGNIIDGAKFGTIDYSMMEFGGFNDMGEEIDSEGWIRTKDYIDISYKPEIFDKYYFGRYGGYSHPHGGRLNKIIWFNSENEVVESKIIGTYINYSRPQNGIKFKIACLSDALPTQNEPVADDNCWARLGVSCTSLFWDIRIGYNKLNESGCLSVVGDTKGLVFRDSVIQGTGRLNGWSVDFEDGWYLMRSCMIINSIVNILVNHSSNLSSLNSFFDRYTVASYSARNTAIECVLNTTAGIDFTQEKEVFTTVRCLISKIMNDKLTTQCMSVKQDCTDTQNTINYNSYIKTIVDSDVEIAKDNLN